MIYRVEKYLDGFSTCFRQWNAKSSHCRFLHGYAIAFKLHLKAHSLDKCHWVWDFGWLKNKKYAVEEKTVQEWFHYMFDHTVVLSREDPELKTFINLDKKGILQLRILPSFSCERIAEFVLEKLQPIIHQHSQNLVDLYKIDVYENDKNMASVECE